MTDSTLTFIYNALEKLERSVETAATTLARAANPSKEVTERISAYREIVRRQRSLLNDLSVATRRRDWREVSRITNLVHGSSLMINVDAGFLIQTLKNQGAPHDGSSNTTH